MTYKRFLFELPQGASLLFIFYSKQVSTSELLSRNDLSIDNTSELGQVTSYRL